MTGPEFDPLRAYANTPVPQPNPWLDEDESPTPATSAMGPAVLGILPSAKYNKRFQSHDEEFLKTARTGRVSLFQGFISSD